jgi:hypothetical protein
MPSMGSGAADGLQQVLKQLFLERQLQQQADIEARRAGQADRGLDLDTERLAQQGDQFSQRLGFDQGKLTEDTRQFDVSSGQTQQRIDQDQAMQPGRLRLIGAQAADLERQPQEQQQDRDFSLQRDKMLHGYRLGEINARSGDSRAADWQIVQSVNPQTNETVSVRINKQTGEAQPVNMPGGLQPGGSRQTRLSAGQQDDLSTMDTVQQLGQQALALGDSIGWEGVGGLGQGSMSQFMMKNFGKGNPKAEELRNMVGNIQGTIAKLRGGTAFSAQEKTMLDSYTPTINDSAPQIKAKLSSLNKFIALKRDSTMKYAGGGAPQAAPATPQTADPLGIRQ